MSDKIHTQNVEKKSHGDNAQSEERSPSDMSDNTNALPTKLPRKIYIIVPGMGSDHCAGLVKTSLKRLDGVEEIQTNIATHRVEVIFDQARLTDQNIKKAVEKAGYDVDSMQAADEADMFLTVPGMGSDHCAGLVTTSIQRLAGISNVITNIAIHRVTVTSIGRIKGRFAIEGATQPRFAWA